MTRLAPVETDFDVWYERREAERILVRIGFHPMWQQHRAEAAADVAQTPDYKRPPTMWADVAAEAVFYAGMGMPVEDVAESIKQTPGLIARSLRRAGQDVLADRFLALTRVRAA